MSLTNYDLPTLLSQHELAIQTMANSGIDATVRAALAKQLVYMSTYATGDGTDETTAIQAALDAAPGKILIWTKQTGTNYMTNPLFISSNTHIVFEPGTLVKAKTGYTEGQSLLTALYADNVLIEGNFATIQMIKADSIGTEQQRHCMYLVANTNLEVRNIVTKDAGGDGMLIGGRQSAAPYTASSNVKIINCVFDNHKRQGISVVGNIDNVLIDGCTITNIIGTNPQSGIDIEPMYAAYDNTNITVRNCTLKNNVAGIQVLNNSYNVKVYGNYLYNSGAIYTYRMSTAWPSPTADVYDNIVTDSSTATSISVVNCTNVRVYRNRVLNSAGCGIYLDCPPLTLASVDNEVFENYIDVCGTQGINVQDCSRTRINNNTVKNTTYHAIYVRRSDTGNAISKNEVCGNRIYTSAMRGIAIQSSPDTLVSGNYIDGCVDNGISIVYYLNTCDNCDVINNTILNCAAGSTLLAIKLVSVANCKVIGNKIRKGSGSTLYGIDIDSGCTTTLVEDNDLYTSAATDIHDASTSTIILKNKRNDGTISPYRAATLPTAAKGWLGSTVIQSGASVDDTYHICILNSSAAYMWKTIALT